MKFSRANLWLFICAAAFTAAAVTLWTCAPVMKEDVAFREMLRYFNGGSDRFSFWALSDYINCQREVDNGRLANIISPLATLYGTALLRGLIAGSSLGATYLFLALLARGDNRPSMSDTFMFGAVAAAGYFALPFRDNMVVFDYALNYILSSALCFAFCLGTIRALEQRCGSGWETVAVCLAGFLAGANHDGFALPMLAAFGCYALFWRKLRLPVRCWAMGIALLAGSLIPITAPAEWNRASEAVAGGISLVDSLKTMAKFAPGVFLPLALIPLAIKGKRIRGTRAILWMLWFFSIAIFLPFGLDARQGWLPGCAAMGLAMSYLHGTIEKFPWRFNLFAGCGLTVAAVALTLYAAKWQRIVAQSDTAVMEALRNSPDGTAYIDRIDASTLPKLSFARLANDQGNLSVSYGPLNLNAPKEKLYVVVPASVADYTPQKGRRINGTARMIEFEGHLLLDSIPQVFDRSITAGRYSEAWLTIDYHLTSGRDISERHRAYRFKLPDGTPMVYVIADGLRHTASNDGPIVRADLKAANPFPPIL